MIKKILNKKLNDTNTNINKYTFPTKLFRKN